MSPLGGGSTWLTCFATAATDSFTVAFSDGLAISNFETRPSFSIRTLTSVEIFPPEGLFIVGWTQAAKKRSCNILPYQPNSDALPPPAFAEATAGKPLALPALPVAPLPL